MEFDQQTARAQYEGREIKLYGSHQAQFDGLTTNRQDYVRHPLEGRPETQRGQWSGEQRAPATTFRDDMPNFCDVLPNSASLPSHGPPSSTPLISPPTPHITAPSFLALCPTGNNPKFEGATTYNSDFYRMQMPERAHAPVSQYQPTSAPFDGAWSVSVQGACMV